MQAPAPEPPESPWQQLRARLLPVRTWLARHEKLLWWAHSLYALGIGVSIVLFAQRGLEQARWLLYSSVGAWLILLFLSWLQRAKEQHAQRSSAREGEHEPAPGEPTQEHERPKWGFLAVTYVLKNLYQGMLFFTLPFYFKSSSFDSANVGMLLLLGLFALLSTLDVVFDRVIVRRTWIASVFHGVVLFASINLVTPSVFDETRASTALVLAALIAALGTTSLHLVRTPQPWRRALAIVAAAALSAMLLAHWGRRFVPVVPMHVNYARIGPAILPNGKLTMEVSTLDRSVLSDVYAITDIVLPAGKRDDFVHVWRRNGEAVFVSDEAMARVPSEEGSIRLRSMMPQQKLPAQVVGRWTVDVETLDGRLIGRARFTVTE